MACRDLHSALVETAKAAGFPLAGGVDIAAARAAFGEHLERYDRWLAAGHAGAMTYLERGRERRADPAVLLPGARSVFCVGLPYDPRPLGPAGGPRYARYFRGIDYHEDLAVKLEAVLKSVRELGFSFQAKICVDHSAVLERSWAALAGLGWIGKNTLLIHPRLGSYFFLAEALLDVELERSPAPIPDVCGHCERCLVGCPTAAFPEPRWLDSNRCISYRTLEHRGTWGLPNGELAHHSDWVAGCDVCQEVCPFNLKAARQAESAPLPGEDLYRLAWRDLLAESDAAYRARTRDSALSRVRPAQFARNLAVAFANALTALPTSEVAGLVEDTLPLIQARLRLEAEPETRVLWELCRERLYASVDPAKRTP